MTEDDANKLGSDTKMSADEIMEMYDEIEAEEEHAQAICDELEGMEFAIEATHAPKGNREIGQWREISLRYEFDREGIGEAMPIDLVRWANERGLVPRSNFEMSEYDQWSATFVVGETL